MNEKIQTRPYNPAFDVGWERIWGKPTPEPDVCGRCHGSGTAGYVGGDDDEIETCIRCHGTGRKETK